MMAGGLGGISSLSIPTVPASHPMGKNDERAVAHSSQEYNSVDINSNIDSIHTHTRAHSSPLSTMNKSLVKFKYSFENKRKEILKGRKKKGSKASKEVSNVFLSRGGRASTQLDTKRGMCIIIKNSRRKKRRRGVPPFCWFLQ